MQARPERDVAGTTPEDEPRPVGQPDDDVAELGLPCHPRTACSRTSPSRARGPRSGHRSAAARRWRRSGAGAADWRTSMTGMVLRQSSRPAPSSRTTERTSRSPAGGASGSLSSSRVRTPERREIGLAATRRRRRVEPGLQLGLGQVPRPADRGDLERRRLTRTQEQPARRNQDRSQVDGVDDAVGPSDGVGLEFREADRLPGQLDRLFRRLRDARQHELIGVAHRASPGRSRGV